MEQLEMKDTSKFVREMEFEITKTQHGYTGALKERGTIKYYVFRDTVDYVRQDIYQYMKFNNDSGFTPIAIKELATIRNEVSA